VLLPHSRGGQRREVWMVRVEARKVEIGADTGSRRRRSCRCRKRALLAAKEPHYRALLKSKRALPSVEELHQRGRPTDALVLQAEADLSSSSLL